MLRNSLTQLYMGEIKKILTYRLATWSPLPQNLASSSMPSSWMTVESTSKQTASASLQTIFTSSRFAILRKEKKKKIRQLYAMKAVARLTIQLIVSQNETSVAKFSCAWGTRIWLYKHMLVVFVWVYYALRVGENSQSFSIVLDSSLSLCLL